MFPLVIHINSTKELFSKRGVPAAGNLTYEGINEKLEGKMNEDRARFGQTDQNAPLELRINWIV